MKTITRINPWQPPKDDAHLTYLVSCLACCLENGYPRIADIITKGRAHPNFHNLLIELRNIQYVLQKPEIPRDDSGRIKHPSDIKRGVQ